MSAEFVAWKQPSLDVLIERSKRNAQPGCGLFRPNKAVVLCGHFFPNRKYNRSGIGTGSPEKCGGLSAKSSFVRTQFHKDGECASHGTGVQEPVSRV